MSDIFLMENQNDFPENRRKRLPFSGDHWYNTHIEYYGGIDMEKLDNPSICFENLRQGHALFHEDAESLGGFWRILTLGANEPIPEGITEPDFSDKAWEKVSLPVELPTWEHLDDTSPAGLLPKSKKAQPQSTNSGVRTFLRRSFRLSADWQDRPTILRFGGVGAAMRLWVNGKYAGMTKSGLLAVEFDISSLLGSEKNCICLELIPAVDADSMLRPHQWVRRGIFGDIELYTLPFHRIDDLFARSEFQSDGTAAALHVTLFTSNADGLLARIAIMKDNSVAFYGEGVIHENQLTVRIPCLGAALWSREHPELYRIAVILSGDDGILHTREIPFGFRKLEMDRNGMLLNGTPLKLCGVNYRRCKSDEATLRQDLETMRRSNINAVMVQSSLPDRFYDLCDELGMYVIDSSCLQPPQSGMETATRQIEEHLILSHRSHPSILIWDIHQRRGQIDLLDPSRPVMGDFFAIDHPDIDRLQQYLKHEDIDERPSGLRRLLSAGTSISKESYQDLPFLVTRFGEVCGNGVLPTAEFTQLMWKYPQLCGIFLWNFADESCNSQWNSGCLTGLVTEEGKAHDLLETVRNSFQNLSFLRHNSNITVQNHDPVHNLQDFTIVCQLLLDGTVVESFQVSLTGRPGEAATFPLQLRNPMLQCGHYALCIRASIGEVEYARESWVMHSNHTIREDNPGGSIRDEDGNVVLRAEKMSYTINRSTGNLDQITMDGIDLLTSPLEPEFCRPKTPFDESQKQSEEWEKLTLKKKLPKPSVFEVDHMTRSVTVSQSIGAGLLRTYRLYSSGALEIEFRFRTAKTAPTRVGLSCSLPMAFSHFSWMGSGPMDTYSDRMAGSEYGLHSIDVSQSRDLYPVIQEYGNKMNVHLLKLTDTEGTGIQISCEDGMCAGVREWNLEQLCGAENVASLPQPDQTTLNLDVIQNGLNQVVIAPHTTYTYRFILEPAE